MLICWFSVSKKARSWKVIFTVGMKELPMSKQLREDQFLLQELHWKIILICIQLCNIYIFRTMHGTEKGCHVHHWSGNVITLKTSSSLAAQLVVTISTLCAACGENFVNITFPFQWLIINGGNDGRQIDGIRDLCWRKHSHCEYFLQQYYLHEFHIIVL